MIFRYYPEDDMLYIELVRKISTDSEEVADGVVLDFDEHQNVIGIEIEEAGKRADLSKLEVAALPLTDFIFRNAVVTEDLVTSG